MAWRAEAERLAPQLSRIKVSASALAAGGLGEWSQRWDRVRAALGVLRSEAPPALDALRRLSARVGEQLERVAAAERRLNGGEGVAARLEAYAERRARAAQLEADVAQHEDLQQVCAELCISWKAQGVCERVGLCWASGSCRERRGASATMAFGMHASGMRVVGRLP